MSDFVKLYHKIVDQFEGDGDLLGLYSYILHKAAWGDYVFNLRKSYPAKQNEYITTLQGLVDGLGKDKRRIIRELNVLVEMGVITFSYLSKQSLLITITNTVKNNALASASQIPKARKEPKSCKLKSGKCHDSKNEKWQMPQLKSGKCHDSTNPNMANATIQEIPSLVLKERIKEDSEKKIHSPKIKILKFSDEDSEIAIIWLKFAIQEMTWTKPPSFWNEENFAKEIAKIRKAVDLNQLGFKKLLEFIENDDFWCKNALSPAGMLKISRNTGLRKIDTILGQMKTKGMRLNEKMERWKDEPIPESLITF